jgi:hypothetical protein
MVNWASLHAQMYGITGSLSDRQSRRKKCWYYWLGRVTLVLQGEHQQARAVPHFGLARYQWEPRDNSASETIFSCHCILCDSYIV